MSSGNTVGLFQVESAGMRERGNKCMFFYGMDKVEDGAYYSKVDQIKSYLLKKIKCSNLSICSIFYT